MSNPEFNCKKHPPCGPHSAIDFYRNMPHWKSPTMGSPDILSMRMEKNCRTHPYNHTVTLEPHSGKSMIGICILNTNESREYLQCKLIDALVPGKRYKISFWVARKYTATVASASIGAHFTPDEIRNTETTFFHLSPTVQFDTMIENYKEWLQLTAEFTVNESVQYLTIGNFKSNEHTPKKVIIESQADWNYVYIDDVVVEEVLSENEEPAKAIPEKKQMLDLTVNFEIKSHEIPAVSFPELEALVKRLHQNPELILDITGYTDNQGIDAENEALSLRRARSIANFLKSKGIAQDRIKCHGMGSKAPIASNETDSGRQQNRRVEFKLIHP